MKMSSADSKNIESLYESIVMNEMDSMDVLGGSSELQGGDVENSDSYATNDQRLPYLVGIQRRNGKKSKKLKKIRKNDLTK